LILLKILGSMKIKINDRQLIQEYYRISKRNRRNGVDNGDKDFNVEYIRHKYRYHS